MPARGGARDLRTQPAVADAAAQLAQLGEIVVDTGHAAGHVDDHVGTEQQRDAVLPAAAVDTGVGDRHIDHLVRFGGGAAHEQGDRPDQSRETGGLRTGRPERVGHPAHQGPAPVITADVVGRAALRGEEVPQYLQMHARPEAGVAAVGRFRSERHGPLGPGEALGTEVPQKPEPPHAENQAHRVRFGRGGDDGAVEGGPDVVEVRLQACDPGELVAGAKAGLGLLDQCDEVRGVRARGGGADVRGLGGAFGGVLVDGLQEAVAHLTGGGRGGDDEGLVDESADQVGGGVAGRGLRRSGPRRQGLLQPW